MIYFRFCIGISGIVKPQSNQITGQNFMMDPEIKTTGGTVAIVSLGWLVILVTHHTKVGSLMTVIANCTLHERSYFK